MYDTCMVDVYIDGISVSNESYVYTNPQHINRSLNRNKLSKLFDNHDISFEILEKLGFQWKNNRLILEYELTDFKNITKNIKFCRLTYSLCSKITNVVINLLNYYKNHNNHQQNENKNDDGNDNVDALIAEMIDALPTSVLEENADMIDKCVQKNDFQALKQFLQKKSIPWYAKRSDWYVHRDAIDDTIAATAKNVGASLDTLLAGNDANIVEWLYGWNLPRAVTDSLIEMIIEFNFDLTNKDDKLWFAKIIADRVVAVDMYHREYEWSTIVHKLVVEPVDCVTSSIEQRELVSNFYILLERHKENGRLRAQNRNKWLISFHQDAQQYLQKFSDAAKSQSKEKCQSLLRTKNNSIESRWKCYHCKLMNNDNVNQCLGCNKGINPLWPARKNESETFCVSKPFGLIKWGYQVTFQVYRHLFFVFFFPEISRNFSRNTDKKRN